MPQTLFALLGMILASLLAFSQQRNAVSNYSSMVGNEAELAASGAMMHVLELIGSRSFDERTTPDGIRAAGSLPSSANEFSHRDHFGGQPEDGCDLQEPFQTPSCDDVDDLHGYQDIVYVPFSSGLTLEFDVSISVSYAVEADMTAESPDRTRHKYVVVTAESDLLSNGRIQVERIISYDPNKAEADYEYQYGALDA